MKRFQKGYTLAELVTVLVAGAVVLVVVLVVLALIALAAAWLAGRVF